jgi:hypothetical protein
MAVRFASVGEAMGRIRPGRAQVRVLHLEPKRAGATLGYAFLALLALGIVVVALHYRDHELPKALQNVHLSKNALTITAMVAGFFALLLIGAAIHNGRRWHVARAVERLSNDPTVTAYLPDTEGSPAPQRAATIPPLEVRVVKARKLAKPKAKLRRVTLDKNVTGDRPLRIAYLRLFENQPRIRTFIEGAWREFGYVYLLRSAASVTPAEFRRARKSGNFASLFIASQEQLVPALEGGGVEPKGRHKFRTIGPTAIKVRDKYGSYGVHALLCHGTFWRAAVDVLLDRVDQVALDLSGFLPQNLGTHYELQRVIDRFPIERVVFLADQRSRQKFIIEQLQLVWSQMGAGSPNAVPDRKVAMVVVTDRFAYRRTQQGGQAGGAPGQPQGQAQSTQIQVRLVARRRETRRVAAMAQTRLGE